MRLRRLASCLACLGVVCVLAERAGAEPASCGAERPWVELSFVLGAELSSQRVLADLRAGLSAARIDVCEPEPGVARAEPLARLEIAPSEQRAGWVRLAVHDAVTEKALEREIDLSRVPSDGRAFALAVAAEELLRASWAELSVPSFNRVARRASDARPERVPAAPAQPAAPQRTRGNAVGLGFAYESYRKGSTELGADVFWLHAFLPRFSLGVAAGVRAALTTTAPDGTIAADALHAELVAQGGVLRGPWAKLDLLCGLSGKWQRFSVDPAPDARGSSTSGFALYARGGLELSLGGPGISSRTRAGAGAPLRSFSVSDAGTEVTGLRGLELFSSTGVAVEF